MKCTEPILLLSNLGGSLRPLKKQVVAQTQNGVIRFYFIHYVICFYFHLDFKRMYFIY